MGTRVYDEGFYNALTDDSARSAAKVVPMIIDLFHPSSVLDVGCGTGTWLAEFVRHGVDDIIGVDGGFADTAQLRIRGEQFRRVELEEGFDLNRTFDLVVSLEVAEHLSPAAADRFVESLCRHSDRVVFSAAIPGQFGLNHVNCQWQDYWSGLFEQRGFSYFDELRWRTWGEGDIAAYYRQNIMIFAKGPRAANLPAPVSPPRVVHPDVYADRCLVPITGVISQRLRQYGIRTKLRASVRTFRDRFDRRRD